MEYLVIVSHGSNENLHKGIPTLIGRIIGELSLRIIHHHATDDVAGIDEDLGEEESLPEVISVVVWSAYFQSEFS